MTSRWQPTSQLGTDRDDKRVEQYKTCELCLSSHEGLPHQAVSGELVMSDI